MDGKQSPSERDGCASTNCEEDEWEHADASMISISAIEAPHTSKPPSNKPPMVFTSLKYTSHSEQGIYIQSSSDSTISVSEGKGSLSSTISNVPGVVDSALLSAMANPRERMILFQIEDSILKFMQSSDRSMEISPGYNSFRRLLAYRVGQRFGLSHSTFSTEPTNEAGAPERCITLFKTPASSYPRVLLIDLPADYAQEATEPITGSPDFAIDASLSSCEVFPGNAESTGPRRMQLMKRQPAKTGADPKGAAPNRSQATAQSSEDKERAYLEARARIFGNPAVGPDDAAAESVDPDSVVSATVAPLESSLSPLSKSSRTDLSGMREYLEDSGDLRAALDAFRRSEDSKAGGPSMSSYVVRGPHADGFHELPVAVEQLSLTGEPALNVDMSNKVHQITCEMETAVDNNCQSDEARNSKDKSDEANNSTDKSDATINSDDAAINDKTVAANTSKDKSVAANNSKDKSVATNNSKSVAASNGKDKSVAANNSKDKSVGANKSKDKSVAANNSKDKSVAANSSKDKSVAANSSKDKSVAANNSEANKDKSGATMNSNGAASNGKDKSGAAIKDKSVAASKDKSVAANNCKDKSDAAIKNDGVDNKDKSGVANTSKDKSGPATKDKSNAANNSKDKSDAVISKDKSGIANKDKSGAIINSNGATSNGKDKLSATMNSNGKDKLSATIKDKSDATSKSKEKSEATSDRTVVANVVFDGRNEATSPAEGAITSRDVDQDLSRGRRGDRTVVVENRQESRGNVEAAAASAYARKGELGSSSGKNDPPAPPRSSRDRVDTASWKENKSHYRNVDAERADPEFSRTAPAASHPAPPPAPAHKQAVSSAGGGNSNSNSSSLAGMMRAGPPPVGAAVHFIPTQQGFPEGGNMMPMNAALSHETFYPQHLAYPPQQFSTADGQYFHAMGPSSPSMVIPQYYLSERVYPQSNSLVAVGVPNQLYGGGMVVSPPPVAMHSFFPPGPMMHYPTPPPPAVHLTNRSTPATAANPYLLSADLQQYSLQQQQHQPQQFQPVYSSEPSQLSFSAVAANQQRRSTFLSGQQQQHIGGKAADKFNQN